MALGFKYYRDKWIHLCILSVGLGAFLWAYAKGEAKAEAGVVPLVVGMAVVCHVALVMLMLRAKKREALEKQALLNAVLRGESTETDEQ